MTKKKPSDANTPDPAATTAVEQKEETTLEAIASICSVLAVLLFIQTFIAQNYVIPSGSMEPTLLVGDHLAVDRSSLAPPANWIKPLIYYRQPHRGDVVVFIKPVPDQVNGKPQYLYLVKRLIAVPGDHLQLQDGTVYVNGVAQSYANAQPTTADNFSEFLDDFPQIPAATQPDATEEWAVAEPNYIKDGDLVVPPGHYFMMGDNRHNSLDSRYWGFVPRANVIGRPLFNYWSFKTPEDEYNQTGLGAKFAWMGHIVVHFFTGTRWDRTFHVIH